MDASASLEDAIDDDDDGEGVTFGALASVGDSSGKSCKGAGGDDLVDERMLLLLDGTNGRADDDAAAASVESRGAPCSDSSDGAAGIAGDQPRCDLDVDASSWCCCRGIAMDDGDGVGSGDGNCTVAVIARRDDAVLTVGRCP